jgi:hypothetical protein
MSGGKIKDVVAVSGKVTLDGAPQEKIVICLHAKADGNLLTQTETNADGTYCWAKYKPCDGVEAGEYKLTFQYRPKANRKGEGVDVLEKKYGNPKKSEILLTVEAGKPQKDVNYELVTK